MTRKMVSLFLALVMLLSMASISAVAEEKTQVLVWTNARHDYDFFVDLINRYNAENDKNIEITMEVYTDNYAQALELAFDTGKGPDLFTVTAGAWTLVQNGQGEPLNDYLTPEQYEYFGGDKSFVESVNKFDGKILSLPFQTSTPRLVYNKDLLDRAGVEKVPETFEEVVAAAKQVTDQLKGEGIYGFAINLKSPGSALGRTLDYMMQLNEGIREGYNFQTGKYEFERLEKISSYLKQMFDDGYYNNYLYAYPTAKRYGMKFVLSPIGKYADLYTETPDKSPYYAHCTWDMLREMQSSGVVEIANHTYDLHSSDGARLGTKQLSGESLEDYTKLLTEDVTLFQQKAEENLQSKPVLFAYPFGAVSKGEPEIIKNLGFKVTLSCEERVSTVTRAPESLYYLGRYLRPSGVNSESFFEHILKA